MKPSRLWKDTSGQFELLLLLVPLLFCCLMRSRGRQGASTEPTATDVWFTPKNIEDVFRDIGEEVDGWRQKAETEKAAAPKYFSFLDASKKEEKRFEVVQSIQPRLYRVFDKKEGGVLFELTEVKGGGTSIRATYTTPIKFHVQTFRAHSPVQIPHDWKPCSSCGRLVLHDYVKCPYCGQEQVIAEEKPK